MNIAACQYRIELLPDWKTYSKKIISLVIKAKEQDVELLLLPEYAGTEIACKRYDTDFELYQAIQPLIPAYIEFYKNLAKDYQIYIQPGSIIEEASLGNYYNRAYFFGPAGTMGFQDKLRLVEFEKEQEVIKPGKTQVLFNTSLGKIGIAICYDSEFPEIVRSLTMAGAFLILVPSYNNSLASHHRVFYSCRARAIENQSYLISSCAVGEVNISGFIENTVGKAAIVGPIDDGFPEDGIITKGIMNEEALVIGSVYPEKLKIVRKQGRAHNFLDSQFLENFILSECNI